MLFKGVFFYFVDVFFQGIDYGVVFCREIEIIVIVGFGDVLEDCFIKVGVYWVVLLVVFIYFLAVLFDGNEVFFGCIYFYGVENEFFFCSSFSSSQGFFFVIFIICNDN